ncbi:YlbF family regulator [Emergencia timonensis]|uniref:YlbF family regulator n=1 Tax=Emergencia timonensis TaxID=1776384 RepID=UPI0039948A36
MNVYDQAHGLAAAIRESEEFKQYDQLKKVVDQNEELSKMIKDFQSKQFEAQAKQMMGEESAPDINQQIQNLYQIIVKDPMAAQYMQAEMRFSLMMNDVYKILGEVMGLGNIG